MNASAKPTESDRNQYRRPGCDRTLSQDTAPAARIAVLGLDMGLRRVAAGHTHGDWAFDRALEWAPPRHRFTDLVPPAPDWVDDSVGD